MLYARRGRTLLGLRYLQPQGRLKPDSWACISLQATGTGRLAHSPAPAPTRSPVTRAHACTKPGQQHRMEFLQEAYAVRLDGTEREVLCRDGQLGEQVERSTLAHIRQADNAAANTNISKSERHHLSNSLYAVWQ